MWLVLGLGYMFMITELLSQQQYVQLLRRVSKNISTNISKRFRKAKKSVSGNNNRVPSIRINRISRSLYVTIPKEKAKNGHVTIPKEKATNGHKKLCVSASV